MDRYPVTSSTTSPGDDPVAYLAACSRVMQHAVRLVEAQGLAASVDIDPGRAPSEAVANTHEVHVAYGRHKRVVSVDHDTFMDDEFFRTLVLHQLKAAIDDLAEADWKEKGPPRRVSRE
jgi:hypothetical protein